MRCFEQYIRDRPAEQSAIPWNGVLIRHAYQKTLKLSGLESDT